MARKKLTPAELVRERFGGYSKAAHLLGYKSRVAVYHWYTRGRGTIPTHAHVRVLQTAKENKIPFTAEEVINGGFA
jgi:hypothetical protein